MNIIYAVPPPPINRAIIKLTKGEFALIDAEDYDDLTRYIWVLQQNYASMWDGGKRVAMHRYIMKAPPDLCVDHINGDCLDNRKCNMRLCTISQNAMNRTNHLKNKTGYVGVYKAHSMYGYYAQIRIDGVKKHIGNFNTKEEAARAYREATFKYHGEFATLKEVGMILATPC